MARIKALSALLLLVVLGVGGFYVYRNGWRMPTSLGSLFTPEDAATANRVKMAFGASKRLAGYPLDAKSSGGGGTLTGQLQSESLKTLAGEIARDTKGVNEVNNQIAVDTNAQPSSENAHVDDLEIRASILEAVAKSPELGGKNIDV